MKIRSIIARADSCVLTLVLMVTAERSDETLLKAIRLRLLLKVRDESPLRLKAKTVGWLVGLSVCPV